MLARGGARQTPKRRAATVLATICRTHLQQQTYVALREQTIARALEAHSHPQEGVPRLCHGTAVARTASDQEQTYTATLAVQENKAARETAQSKLPLISGSELVAQSSNQRRVAQLQFPVSLSEEFDAAHEKSFAQRQHHTQHQPYQHSHEHQHQHQHQRQHHQQNQQFSPNEEEADMRLPLVLVQRGLIDEQRANVDNARTAAGRGDAKAAVLQEKVNDSQSSNDALAQVAVGEVAQQDSAAAELQLLLEMAQLAQLLEPLRSAGLERLDDLKGLGVQQLRAVGMVMSGVEMKRLDLICSQLTQLSELATRTRPSEGRDTPGRQALRTHKTTSVAAAAEAEADRLWHEVDTDRDGVLDKEEVKHVLVKLGQVKLVSAGQKLQKVFERMESNHDGKVGKTEFIQWWSRQAEKYQRQVIARGLREPRASALTQQQSEIFTSHEEKVASLQAEWEARLAAQEVEAAAALEAAVSEHDQALASVAVAHDERANAMSATELELATKHEEAAARLESLSEARVSALASKHDETVASHEALVATMRDEHTVLVGEQGAAHEKKVASLQAEWEARLAAQEVEAAA
eukprot:SAG11_NODE_3574_length_2359_cov_4.825221_1_plen_577_part_01